VPLYLSDFSEYVSRGTFERPSNQRRDTSHELLVAALPKGGTDLTRPTGPLSTGVLARYVFSAPQMCSTGWWQER
jgi:hypothetical protein